MEHACVIRWYADISQTSSRLVHDSKKFKWGAKKLSLQVIHTAAQMQAAPREAMLNHRSAFSFHKTHRAHPTMLPCLPRHRRCTSSTRHWWCWGPWRSSSSGSNSGGEEEDRGRRPRATTHEHDEGRGEVCPHCPDERQETGGGVGVSGSAKTQGCVACKWKREVWYTTFSIPFHSSHQACLFFSRSSGASRPSQGAQLQGMIQHRPNPPSSSSPSRFTTPSTPSPPLNCTDVGGGCSQPLLPRPFLPLGQHHSHLSAPRSPSSYPALSPSGQPQPAGVEEEARAAAESVADLDAVLVVAGRPIDLAVTMLRRHLGARCEDIAFGDQVGQRDAGCTVEVRPAEACSTQTCERGL